MAGTNFLLQEDFSGPSMNPYRFRVTLSEFTQQNDETGGFLTTLGGQKRLFPTKIFEFHVLDINIGLSMLSMGDIERFSIDWSRK
jgi:hypothetical protein